MWLLGQEKSILGNNKINFGTEKRDFMWQEKFILGHNEASYGANNVNLYNRRSEYWVIMRQIMDGMSWLFGSGEVEIWS